MTESDFNNKRGIGFAIKKYFIQLSIAIKNYHFKPNIREKLTLQFLILMGILLFTFSISIYFFSKLFLEKRFYERLQDKAVTSSLLFFDFESNNALLKKYVDNNKDAEMLNDEVVTIYDINRKLFVFSTNMRQEAFHLEHIRKINKNKDVENSNLKGHKISSIKIKDPNVDYLIIVSAIDNQGEEALKDLKNILFILSIIVLMFITFIGWYLANKAFNPLFYVIDQLAEIFPQNISKRIKHDNKEDEIGALANTINQLLERAENSVHTQKLFVANISHEIKNPLTKIFTQIEVLEMKHKKNPEIISSMISLKEDTVALIKLSNDILQLANLFTEQSSLPMNLLRLDEVLWDAITAIKKWNVDCTVTFKSDSLPENEEMLTVFGNFESLIIVFKNLIDNACKFSIDNNAEIELFVTDLYLKVSIKNNGDLIPDKDLPNVFQPFFRVNATAKGKEGHGVGLAIVERIVKLHKGDIIVITKDNYNIFEVSFPLAAI